MPAMGLTLSYAYRPPEPWGATLAASAIGVVATVWLAREPEPPAAGWVALVVLWAIVAWRYGLTTVATIDRGRNELQIRTRALGRLTVHARTVSLSPYRSVTVRICPCPRFLEARIELTGEAVSPLTAGVRYANGDGTIPEEVREFARTIAHAAGLPDPRVE
jgi:hypothetical protein